MNLEYKYLLDGRFPGESRIWVYQASRLFTLQETFEIEELLKEFTSTWKSHGTPVPGAWYLFFGQFIVLMADDSYYGVSGCSTDGSVRLIKSIEIKYGVNMFDRTTLAFVVKDRIERLPLSQMQYAFDNGFITAETLYFNNTVQTKNELENNWIIPVKESWMAARLSLPTKIS